MGSPGTGARERLAELVAAATEYEEVVRLIRAYPGHEEFVQSEQDELEARFDDADMRLAAALAAGVGVPPQPEKSLGCAPHKEREDARVRLTEWSQDDLHLGRSVRFYEPVYANPAEIRADVRELLALAAGVGVPLGDHDASCIRAYATHGCTCGKEPSYVEPNTN